MSVRLVFCCLFSRHHLISCSGCQFVCDGCIFVPKYDVYDANGNKKYRLRPDTCVCGLCVQCRCDGDKGKCCRFPFIVRHPQRPYEPLLTNGNEDRAQVDVLWAGWKHACCTQKNAYHVVFPQNATVDDKLLLTGAAVLLDMTMFEQRQD